MNLVLVVGDITFSKVGQDNVEVALINSVDDIITTIKTDDAVSILTDLGVQALKKGSKNFIIIGDYPHIIHYREELIWEIYDGNHPLKINLLTALKRIKYDIIKKPEYNAGMLCLYEDNGFPLAVTREPLFIANGIIEDTFEFEDADVVTLGVKKIEAPREAYEIKIGINLSQGVRITKKYNVIEVNRIS